MWSGFSREHSAKALHKKHVLIYKIGALCHSNKKNSVICCLAFNVCSRHSAIAALPASEDALNFIIMVKRAVKVDLNYRFEDVIRTTSQTGTQWQPLPAARQPKLLSLTGTLTAG